MAKILNIETATTACSASLGVDGRSLALKEINSGYTHAENLTVFIDDVLKEANLSIKDLDAVCVSKGPGSYTGLRIGVSTAKGLCFAADKPLLAVNTLQALAFQIADKLRNKELSIKVSDLNSILLCPMIDARRMEVYTAVYNMGNETIKEVSAIVMDEHSLKEFTKKNTVLFFGDGAAKCADLFKEEPNAIFLEDVFPSAKYLAPLAEKAFNENQIENTAYFEPFYLKDFVGKS